MYKKDKTEEEEEKEADQGETFTNKYSKAE